MRRTLATLLLAGAIAAGGCAKKPNQSQYIKGMPIQVAIDKRAGQSAVEVRALRTASQLRLSVRRVTQVTVRREVKNSTYVYEGRGKARWEPLELLLGLGVVPLLPFFFLLPTPKEDGPELKIRFPYSPYLLFVDPTRTLLGNTMSGRLSQRDMFTDAPVERSYRVALPLAGAEVGYRVLDAERAVVVEGRATASRFGEIALNGVGDDTVAVEVTHGGRTWIVAVEEPE